VRVQSFLLKVLQLLREASRSDGNFKDGVARLMARVRTADADMGSGQKLIEYFETRIISKLHQNEKVNMEYPRNGV